MGARSEAERPGKLPGGPHALRRALCSLATAMAVLIGVGPGCSWNLSIEGEAESAFVPCVDLEVDLGEASFGDENMLFDRIFIDGLMLSTSADAHVSGYIEEEGNVDAGVTGDLDIWWVSAGVRGSSGEALDQSSGAAAPRSVRTELSLGIGAFGVGYEYMWSGATPGLRTVSAEAPLCLVLGFENRFSMNRSLAMTATGWYALDISFLEDSWARSLAVGLELRLTKSANLQVGWLWGGVKVCSRDALDGVMGAGMTGEFEAEFGFSGPRAGLVFSF